MWCAAKEAIWKEVQRGKTYCVLVYSGEEVFVVSYMGRGVDE
jgi:hypothetical protein